jgi:E3 ubiquitin-protein ligase HUWE1
MDELIRHHPSLKVPVFEAIKSTLGKIEDLGNAYVVSEDIQQWYKLVPVSASILDEDVVMDIADSEGVEGTAGTDSEQSGSTGNDPTQLSGGEDPALRAHDNMVVSFIDVVGRVRSLSVAVWIMYLTTLTYAVPGRIVPDHYPLQRFYLQHRWT